MTQNTRKPFCGRGYAPDPAEGAYSAPANPLVAGEGLAVPSPRTPSPALGLFVLASPTPTQKLVVMPLDVLFSVPIQTLTLLALRLTLTLIQILTILPITIH